MSFTKVTLLFASTAMFAKSLQPEVLPHTADKFGGIIVNKFAEVPDDFPQRLVASILGWKEQEKRGVWLTLTEKSAALLPDVLAAGFKLHHTQSDQLVLAQWLPEGEASSLPDYATRSAGAAGLVFNEKGEVLVVVEKYKPELGAKLPSTAVKMGEDSADAAVRGVFEKTGIETRVASVVCQWERHGVSPFHVSDVYTVYKLTYLAGKLSEQDSRVTSVQWMSYEELKAAAKPGGTLSNFLAAYEATSPGFAVHRVPDFDGKPDKFMTYLAPADAKIS